jgi:hypothetical protein
VQIGFVAPRHGRGVDGNGHNHQHGECTSEGDDRTVSQSLPVSVNAKLFYVRHDTCHQLVDLPGQSVGHFAALGQPVFDLVDQRKFAGAARERIHVTVPQLDQVLFYLAKVAR